MKIIKKLKIIYKYLCVFISILVSYNCSNGKKYTISYKDGIKIIHNYKPQKIVSVKLDEVLTIPNSKDVFLNNPYVFNIDSFENVYVFDYYDLKIKKFNKDGFFIESFGKIGIGPGEYSVFSSFFIFNNNIFIIDNDQKIMIQYDLNGNFVKNIRLSKIPYNLKQVSSNNIFGSSFDYIKTKHGYIQAMNLSIYDKTLTMQKTVENIKIPFNPKKPTKANPLNTFYSYCTNKGYIYLAKNSYNSYEIDVFNEKGKIKEIIKKSYRKVLFTPEEYKEAKKTINNLSNIITDKNSIEYKKSINGIFIDSKNRLWVCSSEEKNKIGSKFDIFENGILLGSCKLSLPIDFDFTINFYVKFHNDKIYILNNKKPNILVYKYKIFEK